MIVKKHHLRVVLIWGALLVGIGTAGAQSTAKPFPPGFMKNLVQQMQAQGSTRLFGVVSQGQSNFGNVTPGFYRIHATNCVVLAVDPTDNYGCIFSLEGFFVCELNPAPVTAGAASANGNFVGLNVIDSSGDVNEIITYPEK